MGSVAKTSFSLVSGKWRKGRQPRRAAQPGPDSPGKPDRHDTAAANKPGFSFAAAGRPVIDDPPVFSSTPTLLEVPCVCVARRGHTLFRLRRLRRRGGSSRSVSFRQGIQARCPRGHTLRRRDIPPPGLHVGARELTMYETDAQLLTSSSLATVSNGTSRRATSSNL